MTSRSAPSDDGRVTLGEGPLCPLVVGVCPACGAVRHPVPDGCPTCGGAVQRQTAATGRLVSWTVVHHAPPGFTAPYTIAWVELDDVGIGVMGRLATPSSLPLRSGAAVSVREERVPDRLPLVWLAVGDG